MYLHIETQSTFIEKYFRNSDTGICAFYVNTKESQYLGNGTFDRRNFIPYTIFSHSKVFFAIATYNMHVFLKPCNCPNLKYWSFDDFYEKMLIQGQYYGLDVSNLHLAQTVLSFCCSMIAGGFFYCATNAGTFYSPTPSLSQ